MGKIILTKIINALKKLYIPKCALNYKTDFQLLVSVILSAQCTDKQVNLVTPKLFEKYKNINDFANAKLSELEKLIKSTGFYKNKAKSIKNAASEIIKNYNGKIPDKIDELTKISGIGRKTANVILAEIYQKAEGIVVDTHIKRLSYRIGLTKNTIPEKIEIDLMAVIPKKYWIDFAHLLISHGRNICKARKPLCGKCQIKKYCQKNGL
ncbi:MAG TPA: endonuclease III [bacterium]|nr:endonuclease III [bacterium]